MSRFFLTLLALLTCGSTSAATLHAEHFYSIRFSITIEGPIVPGDSIRFKKEEPDPDK
jgi:hypothetical protein